MQKKNFQKSDTPIVLKSIQFSTTTKKLTVKGVGLASPVYDDFLTKGVWLYVHKNGDQWCVLTEPAGGNEPLFKTVKPLYSFSGGSAILKDLRFGEVVGLPTLILMGDSDHIDVINEADYIMISTIANTIGTSDLRCGKINTGVTDIGNEPIYLELKETQNTAGKIVAYDLIIGTNELL